MKRDPKNVDAHRLLGRIYLRSLGDMQNSNNQSREMQKLAIDQYEQIVKLDPSSVEDHLLLGRLYSYSNDLAKAEKEFKTAVAAAAGFGRSCDHARLSSTRKRATRPRRNRC